MRGITSCEQHDDTIVAHCADSGCPLCEAEETIKALKSDVDENDTTIGSLEDDVHTLKEEIDELNEKLEAATA